MLDIVIYGRGKTGQSLYKMLNRLGKSAVFYDDVSGFDKDCAFSKNSLVILSPGVKPTARGVVLAKSVGAKLVSELEYCFKYCCARCVSVTGTNGKTTTCEMINHILRYANVACRLLGNGGIPLSSEVLDTASNEVVVLESSSFQLAQANTFAPYISVFTNLACDHIDYHGNLDEYVLAKTNNFLHQKSGYAIFNADDCGVLELSSGCQCKRLYYSLSNEKTDCYFDGCNIVINVNGICSKTDAGFLKQYAQHNLSNALAAVLAAFMLGVPINIAATALSDYKLLPHRMEVVATINNVTFVNDSKATNVHATVSALRNYNQPLALILGGSDKGERFDEIFTDLQDNVTFVAASGDTANAIARCAKTYGVDVAVFDDIKQAVSQCYLSLIDKGGVVLMSNACASFDKFSGYAERGEYFRQAVKELIDGQKTS